MSYVAKECIKLGRKSSYSTSEFVEVFGGDLKLDGRVTSKAKDHLIMIMANVIMELTSRGKFNLKDF
jgi:hypothetical protein